MGLTLLELPNDVLMLISYECLTGVDRKSLRLVCTHLNEIASRRIFERLYISCHSADQAAFNHVIGDPRLRANVREIIWDDTTFNTHLCDFDTFVIPTLQLSYGNCVINPSECCRSPAASTRENHELQPLREKNQALVDAWCRLRTAFRDEEDESFITWVARYCQPAYKWWMAEAEEHFHNRRTGADGASLKRALEPGVLPRLDSLRMVQVPFEVDAFSGQAHVLSSPMARHWHRSFTSSDWVPSAEYCPGVEWTEYHYDREESEADKVWKWPLDAKDYTHPGPGPRTESQGFRSWLPYSRCWHAYKPLVPLRGLSEVSLALAAAPGSVEHIEISPDVLGRRVELDTLAQGMELRVFRASTTIGLHMMAVLPFLRSLRLSLSFSTIGFAGNNLGDNLDDEFYSAKFAALLKYAGKLEQLDVTFIEDIDLTTFLHELDLPNSLRKLTLRVFQLHDRELVDFVKRNQRPNPMLLCLQFARLYSDVYSDDGTGEWTTFWAWFKSTKICGILIDPIFLLDRECSWKLRARDDLESSWEGRIACLSKWLDGDSEYPFVKANRFEMLVTELQS